MRLLPLITLLLVAHWTLSTCDDSGDFELKTVDCGSPFIEVIKSVQHGPAYPGGKLKSTLTVLVKKDTKGGKWVSKVTRKFLGVYISFASSEGSFCDLIHADAGCELKEGQVLSYYTEPDIPAYAFLGEYLLTSKFLSDDDEVWTCFAVPLQIVKKPTVYLI